jgi:hypothetical protein
MEQRLDATYLRHGPVDRAAAAALVATGLGVGIFLAAWGISFLWRYTSPEIAVHVANPEIHLVPDGPLKVTQDGAFVVAPLDQVKIEPGQVIVKVAQPPSLPGLNSQTAAGDVIKHEVTVFSEVQHGPGTVVTGWNYKDGSGGMPVTQFCYYTSRNPDRSSKRVDLATDGARWPQISMDLVPDLEEALSKCQWWRA